MQAVESTDCTLYIDTSYCGGDGGYNRTASSSAKLLDEAFSYDDSGAPLTGEFVTDVLAIGNAKIANMKMGVAESGITLGKFDSIELLPNYY